MTGRIFISMNPDCWIGDYYLCGASHSLLDAAARHWGWAAIYSLALLLSRRGIPFLEAQIISKMALLFGTTWIVNSIVISGLLVLIVGANFLVQFMPRFPVGIAYLGIFLTLFVSYAVPLEKLLFASMWAKGLTATIVLCLPVFFAGIIFRSQFCSKGLSGVRSRFQLNGLYGRGNSRVGIVMDGNPVSACSCGPALSGFVDRACG
jgi:thiamine transporter ThiT